MVINQRNTAVSTSDTYTVDRWQFVKTNGATESAAQNTDAPAGFTYSLRNTISVGDGSITTTEFSGFKQPIEGYNVADLGFGTANAQNVTVSFWVRSSVTGQYTGNISNSNYTRMCPFNFTINTANTWELKTNTFPGDTTGTWNTTNGIGINLQIYSALGPSYTTGTANTWGSSGTNFGCGSPVNGIASNGNIFAIAGVQLEAGTTASPFEYRQYGTELALCQRYFDVLLAANTDYNIGGTRDATTTFQTTLYSAVPMRTTPTLGVPSGYGRLVCYDTSFSLTVASISAMSLSYAPDNRVLNIFMTTSSVSGAGSVFFSYDTVGTSTGMTVSAEL